MKRRRFFAKKLIRIPKFSHFTITKRQRFVICVLISSIGLFVAENLLGKSGLIIAIFLSLASAFLFWLQVYSDIKGSRAMYVFILPIFLYTLSLGLFYFLVPSRFLTRILLTSLYAVGLYSLYLSQNIFIVSSLRTIPLLSGARIVTFAITFVSFLSLCVVAFTLHLPLIITASLVFVFSFLALFQIIAVAFEKSIKQTVFWVVPLSLCLFEISLILWYWPSTPAFVALFLAGLFYTFGGLSQAWFDKRLFKGVIWEYVWVAAIVFFILIFFTAWRE